MSGAWDEFWAGSDDPAAADAVRASAPGRGLSQFWRDRFDRLMVGGARRLLDLACGAGAVTGQAARVAAARAQPLDCVCIDVSPAAATAAAQRARAEGLHAFALVADAGRVPLEVGRFDLVVSQFGVEYAGSGALARAGGLVAPGGRLVIVAHLDGGPIQEECAANLAVLSELADQNLCALGAALFDALGRPGAIGGPEDMAYRGAVQACARTVEQNPGPAAHYATRLVQDASTLLQRRDAYHRDDAAAWFTGQAEALSAYRERMRSMVEAALGDDEIDAVLNAWRSEGLEIIHAEAMAIEPNEPECAWRLEARRPN